MHNQFAVHYRFLLGQYHNGVGRKVSEYIILPQIITVIGPELPI